MEYFGVKLVDKGKSFKLTRDEFAQINTKPSLPRFTSLVQMNAYTDESGRTYAENWCREYREVCLKNFDLNMKYYELLDKDEFVKSLEEFLNKNSEFVEVTDLNDFADVEGYYLMVLDEYKQVYLGQSCNIKKRVLQHWSKTKQFDRLLCPMYAWDKSVFSIDSFRAFDTTRIFVWKRRLYDGVEADLIWDIPMKFSSNRIGGDITSSIEALLTMNRREL